jgi:flagellin
MSMVINTNTASLIAQQAQTATSKAMDTAMERLSTGKRINSASDDAAGMAMSSRMESQIVGLAAAMRNAGDAQSLINTAEGSYNEVTNILNRMRELAVQAANDTNVASDRTNLQSEITQLNSEINRIASQTTWNGMNLLDGTFSNKQFQIGSESGQTVALNVTDTSSTALGSYNFEAVGGLYLENAGVAVSGASTDPGDYTVLGPKGTTTVAVTAGDSAKEFAAAMNAVTSSTGVTASAVTKVLLSTGSLATAAVDDTPAIRLKLMALLCWIALLPLQFRALILGILETR